MFYYVEFNYGLWLQYTKIIHNNPKYQTVYRHDSPNFAVKPSTDSSLQLPKQAQERNHTRMDDDDDYDDD